MKVKRTKIAVNVRGWLTISDLLALIGGCYYNEKQAYYRRPKHMAKQSSIKMRMIAPCGMNCAICIGHLRTKKTCPGCLGDDQAKPYHCTVCHVKTCAAINNKKSGLCYECNQFPCKRLNQLDKRYRLNYGMSMIDNLNMIKANGKRLFIKKERQRWLCTGCGQIISAHRDECLYCGKKRVKQIYK